MRGLIVAAAIALGSTAAGAQDSPVEGRATAVFAGGCFWCVEADFDKVPGVLETISGFTGGHFADPTYEQVVTGGTGHREAVEVVFDPAQVDYETLLEVFWHSVDPTDRRGQFCDRGASYTTAIYVADDAQRAAAERSRAQAEAELDRKVATPIEDAGPFYPAGDEHQDYYLKHSARYTFYRWNCGRDATVRRVWGERAFAGIPAHD